MERRPAVRGVNRYVLSDPSARKDALNAIEEIAPSDGEFSLSRAIERAVSQKTVNIQYCTDRVPEQLAEDDVVKSLNESGSRFTVYWYGETPLPQNVEMLKRLARDSGGGFFQMQNENEK